MTHVHTHSLTHIHNHAIFSLSLTHTQTHTNTFTDTHTYTYTHTFILERYFLSGLPGPKKLSSFKKGQILTNEKKTSKGQILKC